MNQVGPKRERAARLKLLAQTSGDTLGGRLLRQFWHPVALSRDIDNQTAKPLRILGEDLTLYRGESGRPHLVGGRCAHRLTLLHNGWVEGEEIRCIYHGWKYDGTGQCVQRPAEMDARIPPFKISGHPVREYCGLIFAYLGEKPVPEFDLPRKEVLERTQGVIIARAEKWPCNWFQMIENSLDPTHLGFVHKKGQPSYLFAAGAGISAEIPQLSVSETEAGLELVHTRPKDNISKTNHWIFPNNNHVTVPGFAKGDPPIDLSIWMVPNDDEHTTRFSLYGTPLVAAGAERFMKYFEDCRDYNPADHHVELFEGKYPQEPYVCLVSAQDYVALVGQGPIVARENERLGTSDSGVMTVRKIFLRELEAIRAGRPAKQWRRPSPLHEMQA